MEFEEDLIVAVERIAPYTLIFATIYVLTWILGPVVWSKYDNLSFSAKGDCGSRVGAVLHSCYVAPLAFYAICTTDVWTGDSVLYKDEISAHICDVFLGYMVFDSMVMPSPDSSCPPPL